MNLQIAFCIFFFFRSTIVWTNHKLRPLVEPMLLVRVSQRQHLFHGAQSTNGLQLFLHTSALNRRLFVFVFFRPKCVENSTYESLPFMWNWQTSVKVASLHLTTFPNMPCVFRPELSCRYNSYQEQERIKADQMSALFAVQHIKLCSCSTTKLSNSAWFSCQDVTTTAFSVVSIAQTNGRLVTLFSKL